MSKPINLYIAPHLLLEDLRWSFLFQNPSVLFSDINKNKAFAPEKLGYMSCPAVRSNLKKILTFPNSLDCKYEYDFSNENKQIKNTTDAHIAVSDVRDNGFTNRPSVSFSMGYMLFADEPLDVYFTPPYFDKPGYSNYGSVIPGSFDVGQWFRSYNLEIQLWEDKGNIEFKDGEPLFYAHLMTDRKVNAHRFSFTPALRELSIACSGTTGLFGVGQTLESRYRRFKNIGMRERILAEIKNNVIEENFLAL